MERLRIYETPKTPGIDFNSETGVLEIVGVTIPEDSINFYSPILDWLNEYVKIKPTKTRLVFRLSYVNTSSLQFLYDIMNVLDENLDTDILSIEWHYLSDDEDMRDLGQDFQSSVTAKISLIEVNTV